MKISAVILAKNESENIKDCIKSLKFCSEIVLVDDLSTDATAKLARKMGAKVFVRDMDMDFSAQSNFGMEKATGDWVFFVDADERVSPKLAEEIKKEISANKKYSGYFLKRLDIIWGKTLTHGESGASIVLRIVKKGTGKWKRRVHPHFDIKGETKLLGNPLMHYPHQTLSGFVSSVDRWSSWHTVANDEEGKRSSLFKIIFWPLAHFFRNYFLRRGFMDGMQGFVYATIMSAHSFLSWSKLWLIQRKNSELN